MNLIYRAKNIEFMSVKIPTGTSLLPSSLPSKVIHVDSMSFQQIMMKEKFFHGNQ